jgi:hypothetical protein
MKWLRPFFVLACVASGCSVPSFGYQSVAEQTLNQCRDGKLSPGEADIDCGRMCNQPCASGDTCTDDLDCSSVFCSAGTCTDQTCDDNLKNQDESDIDCGALLARRATPPLTVPARFAPAMSAERRRPAATSRKTKTRATSTAAAIRAATAALLARCASAPPIATVGPAWAACVTRPAALTA